MKNLYLIVLLFLCIQFQACTIDEVHPPNIIFIMADDLGWADVGYNGEDFYETPAIDSLAKMGMRFNRFYPGGPNCAPSRACILTGMYTPRTHIYTPGMESKGDITKMRWNVPCRNRDNDEHLLDSRESVEPEVESVAEVLKKSGYVCASIGKWHIGEDTQGFDYWSEDGRLVSPKKFKYFVDTTVAEDMTHAALNFMDTAAGRPFFLYFNIWEVHTGMAAKKKYVDYYKKKLENYKGKEKINPVYAAEVTVVDNCVRDIYNKVQELGIADNTIIMFTSDNGGLPEMTNNKPLRAGKGSLFEGGIRDPFVTVWPGVVKPGTETDYVITGVDLLPTFAHIAKADLPKEQPVDGKSFFKVLEGENITERGAVYWHYPLYLSGGKKGKVLPIYGTDKPYWRAVPSSAIMKDDWKLIYYHEYDNYKLFNIKNDIREQRDLADKDTLLAKELYNELMNWIKDTKAPLPGQLNPDFKQFH